MTLWDRGSNCHKPQAMPVGKKIFFAPPHQCGHGIMVSLGRASGKMLNETKYAAKYSKKGKKQNNKELE